MSCPIKVNSNTIELIVHTSCHCVSSLLCVQVENLNENDTKLKTIKCIRVKKVVWSDISKCFSHFLSNLRTYVVSKYTTHLLGFSQLTHTGGKNCEIYLFNFHKEACYLAE